MKLIVLFDDHHLGIGDLRMQIAYHVTIEQFDNARFDEVMNPQNVVVDIDGTDEQVVLDVTGETAPEIEYSLPAYEAERQRQLAEQQREQDFAQSLQMFQQRHCLQRIHFCRSCPGFPFCQGGSVLFPVFSFKITLFHRTCRPLPSLRQDHPRSPLP